MWPLYYILLQVHPQSGPSTSGHGMLCTVSDSGRAGGSCELHVYVFTVPC